MVRFKIGDIITAYRKGIHEITDIKNRFYERQEEIPSIYPNAVIGDEYNSLVYYRTLLTDKGTLCKQSKVIHVCDAAYCDPFEVFIKSEEERIQRFKDNLKTVTV